MSIDALDNPTRNAATLRNLVHNFQAIGVSGWLEEVTFDQVVEAWWQAQKRKADRLACRQCNGFRVIDGGYECPRCRGTGLEP